MLEPMKVSQKDALKEITFINSPRGKVHNWQKETITLWCWSIKEISMKLGDHTLASNFVNFAIVFPSDSENVFILIYFFSYIPKRKLYVVMLYVINAVIWVQTATGVCMMSVWAREGCLAYRSISMSMYCCHCCCDGRGTRGYADDHNHTVLLPLLLRL
jgi:hypothetical protein